MFVIYRTVAHKNRLWVVSAVKSEQEWLMLYPPQYAEWQKSFLEFAEGGTLVGFNNHQLDDPLLQKHGLALNGTIDMLVELKNRAPQNYHYTLKSLAHKNGYHSIELYEDREDIGKTQIIYLLWHKFRGGQLIDPNYGGFFPPV